MKEYRTSIGISQLEAAKSAGLPLRTYIRYESDENYGSGLKRSMIFMSLKEKFEITEEKGVLSVDKISSIVSRVFDKTNGQIGFCYLFGSYAKGYANATSDVDLCVSTNMTGLDFVGLIEELRVSLSKKVDLIRISDLKGNIELIEEVMKDGIKIYG